MYIVKCPQKNSTPLRAPPNALVVCKPLGALGPGSQARRHSLVELRAVAHGNQLRRHGLGTMALSDLDEVSY